MSESWVEVIQLDILALNSFMVKSSEYSDELKLIIALANETLKRNGEFARIISKQREAKMYYGWISRANISTDCKPISLTVPTNKFTFISIEKASY